MVISNEDVQKIKNYTENVKDNEIGSLKKELLAKDKIIGRL